MTAVIEMSVRGSSMHGYTKFPQFVRVFGKTGMMFNLSGVAEGMGLDENGNLIFSKSESVDISEARKVRTLYPETAGVQCIGVSDDHIRKLMATPWIDYIIPYHVSGMSNALRNLAGIAGWKDYTEIQHAAPDPKAKKTGDPMWHKEPVFSEFFVTDDPGNGLESMRRSAERYKELCRERGLIPKFNDFAGDPNYWKLLVDRKMINQKTGALIFQKPVKPIFNFREIRKQVREEVANYDPTREQRVFDYIVDHMDEVEETARNVQAEMGGKPQSVESKAAELGNEMTATTVSQFSFAEDGFASQTEKEYNAVRELQINFDGTVAEGPGIKLAKQAKTGIASAILSGNFQLSENGKIGRVNVDSKCYLFETFDDGGVYVTDFETHENINAATMAYRYGGNYGRTEPEGNRGPGSDPAGARSSVPDGTEHRFGGSEKSRRDDQLAGREPGSAPGGDGVESLGAEQSPELITYGPDYAHWRNRMKEGTDKDDPQYSLADEMTPEQRKAFIETFDAQFGEGAAERMFRTHDEMIRAAARAEKRAERAVESKKAAETLAKSKAEHELTAWMMYHNRKLREQQRKYAAEKDKLRKEKSEAVATAVADTKLVERAKADIRVQATEMHLGKKAAEQQRDLKDRMAKQKEKAAERLRLTKDAYKGKIDTMNKLQRNAAKRLLSDKRAVEKRKSEIETQQGPVDTIRKNPRERVKVEKMQAAADAMRTLGRATYRNFVNMAQEIDNFAKRQKGGVYASTLVNVLGASGSTAETIFKKGLVDRAGNRIGESLKDVLLCMDTTGKKVDEDMQALLQDYMLHLHNIDRMSFVSNARAKLDAFESDPEHNWLVGLDSKDLAILVAATDAETANAVFDRYGNAKGKKGWTAADRELAWEYASLLKSYREAEDKPVFADVNGNPVTAETSREIVTKYEAEHDWLAEKANGVYEWWDRFMREWAVGDSLSLAEYERMHETYPHYAPTYRVGKGGPGGANHVGGNSVTVGKATQAAKGSTLEIVPIEDSFANIASKIIRLARTNELYMNIIDTAMLDEEGLFSDMAVFDWDWQTGEYGQTLQMQAILNGETAAEIEEAAKAGLEKNGNVCRLNGWKDGRIYSAAISPDLFKSIADTTGHSANDFERAVLKIGNALTGPMKTAITGANPAFALRNIFRDIPTAIINSTGAQFPKYWAQAVAEMTSNSDNWVAFQALGGTNAGYYNNEKGFAHAASMNPNAFQRVKGAFEWFGNNSEAATRFAEYLSTIDRMGDTYEARLQGIKNSAEVTVDFSRKGRWGKVINTWVPYWNPAVQGIDKLIRSVVDAPEGSTVMKQALKTGGRAAMCTVLMEAILQAVLHGLDRDDEWEELSDRDRAQYYCIPLPGEHKFLKIPKNREWGALLGTPFMLVLEGLDGRQNPFENYVETSLEPNFLPGAIFRPDFKDGGFDTDVIGANWLAELGKNEDFAGRAIVPYDLGKGSLTEQYNDETSILVRELAQLINFSPIQTQYMLTDYFGDFGKTVAYLSSPAFLNSDLSVWDAAADAAKTFFGSFFEDNRYSNQTVSDYYDAMAKLGVVIEDKKNHGAENEYLNSKEYKTQKGLDELYGKQITELNKQVRGLPDGPDKDELKAEIARLAGEAMDFYDRSMAGEISEPQLTAQYAALPESVSNELIRLDSFAKDYAFEPTGNASSKYTDPKNKKREYVLTGDDEAKDVFRTIYFTQYGEVMTEVMGKSKYQKANDQKKVEMLEDARDTVLELTKDAFFDWLAKNRRSTEKSK